MHPLLASISLVALLGLYWLLVLPWLVPLDTLHVAWAVALLLWLSHLCDGGGTVFVWFVWFLCGVSFFVGCLVMGKWFVVFCLFLAVWDVCWFCVLYVILLF